MRTVEELLTHECEDCRKVGELGLLVKEYVSSFPWCAAVDEVLYDHGLEFAAVLLVRLVPIGIANSAIWVIAGDLPPLYLDCEDVGSGAEAAEAYTDLLEDWLVAYRAGRSLDDEIPICYANSSRPLEITDEVVDTIERRLKFMRQSFIDSGVQCDE